MNKEQNESDAKVHPVDTLVTCGCGNTLRYSHFRDGVEVFSCNKYIVCPTYDELIERSKLCFRYENALRQIVNVNAMDYEYRTWAKAALNM